MTSYSIGSSEFSADAIAPGLHIVATPIGNLGDITIRALATLAAADLVLCEDTRITPKLMARYGIKTPLAPYHEHNAQAVRPGILARLKDGAKIALVSDAGTPLISDPGYKLVQEAVAQGSFVTSCPGPSSVIAALSQSGLPSDRFLFLGFLPQKQGERRRVLEEFSNLKVTLVALESPNRIVETLADIPPNRAVAVARELTKLHEEVLRGTAAEVHAKLSAREQIKGEVTLVIAPRAEAEVVDDATLDDAIVAELKRSPPSQAAAAVAKAFGLNKKDVYHRILAKTKSGG